MRRKKLFPTGVGRENVMLIYPVKNAKGTYRFKKIIVHKDKVNEAIKKLTSSK